MSNQLAFKTAVIKKETREAKEEAEREKARERERERMRAGYILVNVFLMKS